MLSSATMRFSKPAAKTAALLPTGPPTAVKEKEKGDGDNDNLWSLLALVCMDAT